MRRKSQDRCPLILPSILARILILFCWVLAGDNLIHGSAVNTTTDEGVTPFVVGGHEARIADYPYQAALLVGSFEFFQICGACIINPTTVITAQHCIYPWNQPYYVGAGYSRLTNMYASEDVIPVKLVIPYPRYYRSSQGKDFSILILESPLKFSKYIQPIRLATQSDKDKGFLDPGTNAWVSGWGSTDPFGGEYPDRLMAGEVYILSEKFAQERLFDLNPDLIAAGKFPGGGTVDTCNGDSGGPLAVAGPTNSKPNRILVGLTSWGYGLCANDETPGVYTYVPAFQSWMTRMVQNLNQAPSRTYEVTIGTIRGMSPHSSRNYRVFIPRGLRAVHFKLDPSSEDDYDYGIPELVVSSNDALSEEPRADCASRTRTCTYIAPVEGVYYIVAYAAYVPVRKTFRVIVEMESFVQNQREISYRSNLTFIAPKGKTYFLGFPTMPGTIVRARLEGLRSQIKFMHLTARGGVSAFRSPVTNKTRLVQRVLTKASPWGATSLMVRNTVSEQASFNIFVEYHTIRRTNGTRNATWVQMDPVLQANHSLGNAMLKSGTELGLEFRMLSGSWADISVYSGGTRWFEWTCLARLGRLTYCGGVVPQYSNNLTISVAALQNSTYSLDITYESS